MKSEWWHCYHRAYRPLYVIFFGTVNVRKHCSSSDNDDGATTVFQSIVLIDFFYSMNDVQIIGK